MKTKMQNILRKDDLSRFGFGCDAMKKLSVCPNCRSLVGSESALCPLCGAKLTKSTLYDLYKAQHSVCSHCGTVLAEGMQFCPHCGQSTHRKGEGHHGTEL